jgi:uncharacterized protein YkwD
MRWMAPLRHLSARMLAGQKPPANGEPSMSYLPGTGHPHTKRREFFTFFCIAATTWPLATFAQVPPQRPLISELAVPAAPAVAPAIAPIEVPPLPRPRPSFSRSVGDNSAVLISAFRHEYGEGPVAISPALTSIAQEQANAMAKLDLLDHNALAPFARRISRSHLRRAAENIAYGYADFAGTLNQWANSTGHRANLLLHGAKWIGVAHAQNGHRMYWAMVIGGK